jgi:6-phosphogluconolactonase
MSIFAPDDDESILVPDLGLDCVHQLTLKESLFTFEGEMHKSFKKIEHPGCGPRHLAIHPSFQYGYLINEMGSHISVFNYKSG